MSYYKRLNKLIKKRFLRLFIKLRNFAEYQTEKKISQNERLALSICRKLILNPESVLMIAPLSNRKYIRNEYERMFIIIETITNKIMIVNHTYSYTISCETKNFFKLVHFFDVQLDKRKMDLEDEITSNIKHSLENINKRISK